jgi:hypothetical protein
VYCNFWPIIAQKLCQKGKAVSGLAQASCDFTENFPNIIIFSNNSNNWCTIREHVFKNEREIDLIVAFLTKLSKAVLCRPYGTTRLGLGFKLGN